MCIDYHAIVSFVAIVLDVSPTLLLSCGTGFGVPFEETRPATVSYTVFLEFSALYPGFL